MKLKTLAGGDAQRAVTIAVGDIIVHEVLVGCEVTARQLCAQHEDIGLTRLGCGRFRIRARSRGGTSSLALVAVFLLVESVEFEQLRARLIKAAAAILEAGGKVAAQLVAVGLDDFYLAGLLGFSGIFGHVTTSGFWAVSGCKK